MKYANLGTISHATMREEDLIPAFAAELDRLCKANSSEDFAQLLNEAEALDFDSEQAQADASEICSELFDALDTFAAPYCYFGAHEGDGSDFGFWASSEALDTAHADGELASGDELPCACCSEHAEFLQISDHGNLTLYARTAIEHGRDTFHTWTEVWSVV